MALRFADRILETTTTTGTGAIALAAAVTGYRRFADAPGMTTGDTCYYSIFAVDSNGNPSGDWETGLGTYSSANTLTRTTPQASTNGGAAVNFAAGTKYVMLTPTAAVFTFREVPVFNFSDAGEARLYADVAMTLTQQATSGTGSVAYEKSTAAAPSTFSSTTSPITLEAGAWLKVTASAVTDIYAVALKRTA